MSQDHHTMSAEQLYYYELGVRIEQLTVLCAYAVDWGDKRSDRWDGADELESDLSRALTCLAIAVDRLVSGVGIGDRSKDCAERVRRRLEEWDRGSKRSLKRGAQRMDEAIRELATSVHLLADRAPETSLWLGLGRAVVQVCRPAPLPKWRMVDGKIRIRVPKKGLDRTKLAGRLAPHLGEANMELGQLFSDEIDSLAEERKWVCLNLRGWNHIEAGLVALERGQATTVPEADSPSGQQVNPQRPRWDSETRRLYLGSELVREFRKHPAPNQTVILNVFEEQDWPGSIDDPLPGAANDRKRRLNDTVKGLNSRQRRIRFRTDGTGEKVLWEVNSPEQLS